ncbi:E3 ubiquitin-protein ligase listerin [Euwallacea fornicatus]|uniref:E3 ubiquitin-protein ligase listerin n=1 Tax=Euwallacea fornicatus TaxID=995702 RepID=UPI0033903274
MGGKQNRTRNNVRPSNSGRSAAMLHSSLPQFSGFSGGNKMSPLSTLAFIPVDELDKTIDSNFQLVLKKVSKKDATTKLKGLQEFTELLENSELSTIKSLLSIWPRFYGVLVIHPDNRIREATQIAHSVIVQKVKREIAPYLKQLMAPWFTSQYDNYPPAATAAIKAFQDSFSPLKFKEAITFCQQEIINYIHDNLVVQSAQTVSSSQLSLQEAEARYERVVISCLQGYAMYLKDVPEENIAESIDLNIQIVSNKKFWKLALNKVALIRSSWFQVLSVILQRARHLLTGKETQTFSTILNNLGDQEITVLPNVWECLLLVSSNPEYWVFINIDQLFVPKLLNTLKQAGGGNASIIYPNLLPLIANLPSFEERKMHQFYLNFFDHMGSGLKLKQTISNTQESNAISQAYIECLQLLLTRNATNSELCNTLITQFCSLLEWCITKEASFASCKVIFIQVSSLLAGLLKNNINETHLLIEYFLKCLGETFDKALNNPSNYSDIYQVSMKEVDLLLNLRSCQSSSNHTNPEFYGEVIHNFTLLVWKQHIQFIEQSYSSDLFESLYLLLRSFDKEESFESLLYHLPNETIKPKLMYIYEKWFKKWLFCEAMFGKNVLDLVFLLLEELDGTDQQSVLDDLLKVNNPECIAWSVSKALSDPHVTNRIVQDWLKGPAIGNFFVSIVDSYSSGKCSSEQSSILEAALKETSRESLLIGRELLDKVIDKMATIILLEKQEKGVLNSTCKLAVDMCKLIYTPSRLLAYGDTLLFTLFNLSCQLLDGQLTEILFEEVNSTWKNSLKILLRNLNDADSKSLLDKFLGLTKEEFTVVITTRNKARFERLKQQIWNIIEVVYDGRPWLLTWIVEFLNNKMDVSCDKVIKLCQMAEYVKGAIQSPLFTINIEESMDNDEILSYFVCSFIVFEIMTISLDHQNEDNIFPKAILRNENCDSPRIITMLEKPEEVLVKMIYSYTVNTSFLSHFNSIKFYSEITYYHNYSETCIRDIIKVFGCSDQLNIKEHLKSLALSSGWFWSKSAHTYYVNFEKSDECIREFKSLSETESPNLEGLFYLRQIFGNDETPSINVPGRFIQHIEKLRQSNMDQFLYKNSKLSWQETNQVIDVVEKCTYLMENCELTTKYWDLIVLSMDAWSSNCLKYASSLVNEYQYQRLVVAIGELFIKTCEKIKKLKSEKSESNYVEEWEDIIVENVHSQLAQIWLFFADYFNHSNQDNLLNLPFLQSFGEITDYLKHDLIFKENQILPKWTGFLKTSNLLLTNSRTVLQMWGYKLLLVLVPGLIKIDEKAINSSALHKKGLIFEQFKEKLVELQDIVNSMLIDFRIGEKSCTVETSYDSFTYTFAYLLLWDVMVNFFDIASPELRFQYSDWLKSGSLLHELLANLFKLIPVGSLLKEESSDTNTNNFLDNPLSMVGFGGFCGSVTIEHFACYLFKSSLEQFPALIRQWWTVLDVRTSQIVEKITVLHVSPILCKMELNNVVKHQSSFKNLKVKILPSVREIQAIYTVDEIQMELAISLPLNYPLGSPEIACNRQLSGSTQKQWLLQFKKCVLHQNGKLWDGLSLWNAYLDRKFDGIEECCICYAVLHSGSYQLPKVSCRTCKKKFHSPCLFKWFSTSNKSSCPICRNLF